MTKTIEEAAWNFARKQWGKQVPHTIDKIADMPIDFGNEIRTMPLHDRLTAEEKERVRKEYSNTYPLDPDCGVANILIQGVLERIFGKEFFKEDKE